MAFLSVVVLIWADLLGEYVMWNMQDYLTDVWELGFTHAAGIKNVADGLQGVLPFMLYFFLDAAFLTHKWTLLLSSCSNVIGSCFLFMSMPPVLANSTGTCTDYEAKCIGETQKILFYAGLAFLTAGMSGHIVSLVDVFADQFTRPEPLLPPPLVDQTNANNTNSFLVLLRGIRAWIMKLIRGNDNHRVDPEPVDLSTLRFQPMDAMLELVKQSNVKVIRSYLLINVPILATLFGLPYIYNWAPQFGIPALLIFLATITFAVNFRRCEDHNINSSDRQGSSRSRSSRRRPVTNVVKVVVAATLKQFKTLPTNDSQLYRESDHANFDTLPRTPRLRFLDKAAIKEGPEWSQCTVTQVEETKMLISMLPFWFTFVACGLVSSIGSTYFVEQQNSMDYHIGKWKLPDSLFFIIQQVMESIMNRVAKRAISFFGNKTPHYALAYAIAISTFSATLCSIVSALVEKRRIDVMREHIHDDIVPMTVFWLLPQYLFLACLNSFYEKSVTPFLYNYSPPSMETYLVFLSSGLSGLGVIGSVLSVYVVGMISEGDGTKPNWFQYYLNDSRLDLYYWTLAGLTGASFIWFVCWALGYPYWKPMSLDPTSDEDPNDEEAFDPNQYHFGRDRDRDESDMTELEEY